MRYSQGFREAVLKKVLPPESRSVKDFGREVGVNSWTIYQWMRSAREGTLAHTGGELRPTDRNPGEKRRLVIEGNALAEEQRGEWLREHGLHSEHLSEWEQELRDIVTDKDQKLRQELAETKKKLKEKERELRRKDKAPAEMAALIARKKSGRDLGGRRGRLIAACDRLRAMESSDENALRYNGN